MAIRPTHPIISYLQKLLHPQAIRKRTDEQLLQDFISRKEEAAFTLLVQRHGRLVMSVCRHVLHHEHDAEDAFQATFLVLARRAAKIRKGDAVGSWLYGVAHRIARKAKKTSIKRRQRETGSLCRVPEEPVSEAALHELQTLLDEEVNRLPEKYRRPFVLCILAGKSREEAAQEMGWKPGTKSSRIAQARALLEQRLARRGVALSAALRCFTTTVADPASSSGPGTDRYAPGTRHPGRFKQRDTRGTAYSGGQGLTGTPEQGKFTDSLR